MDALKKADVYTIDDIYALPDGKFVEEYSFGTDIPVGIYEGFQIKIEQP